MYPIQHARMKTIRWGIIGCGDVTEVKSGPAFQNARGSELVAVMRRNGELAADYARRHNVPRWYADADALINDQAVDAVYIATPPGVHLEMAKKVAAAGKPAYVEKPMARNHRECREMVAAFEQAQLPLFVAYYRRALPRFVKAKELIDTGKLGQITGINYRQSSPAHTNFDPRNIPWRLDAAHAGAGLFLDVGSHTLDVLDFLLGPPVDYAGLAANLASPHAVEDSVVMHFRTPGGAVGSAAWNFASAVHEDLLEVTGTDGRIAMSVFGNDPVRLIGFKTETQFDLPNPPHVHQPLVQLMVDELLGVGKCPSTGVSAARTSAVMDAALAGYYQGRDDDFWQRPGTWGRK
jgi:1,5-anhydro-D-fructose reductase (1,5-anhydro-D-mannitol-forming)